MCYKVAAAGFHCHSFFISHNSTLLCAMQVSKQKFIHSGNQIEAVLMG
jgi:hypothetical protein